MNELSLAREAALEAGEFLKGAYGTNHRVLLENGRDVKLQADRDSEAIILKSLQEGSHWPILSEEESGGASKSDRSRAEVLDELLRSNKSVALNLEALRAQLKKGSS